jgi:hypothetical protein
MESLAWDVHKALQIVKDLEYDLDLEENSQEQRKLLKVVREFGIYIIELHSELRRSLPARRDHIDSLR